MILAGAGLATFWVAKYAAAVHQLPRGVGDTVFYGANGKPWFRLDEQRQDVALADIAPDFQHAVVAIEDRRFYRHPGIDPIGVSRALYRDLRQRAAVEGGSTLTQQLARTLFLSNNRSFARKAREAVIALLIEAELTKDQILQLYLNRVYLSAGVHGVEAMSQHLFRKPAKALTLPESAFIAGLLRAPSALSPWSNYDGALERSRVVLAAMRDMHFITPEQEEAARSVRPAVQPYRQPSDARGAWAKDYLRQQFQRQFGGDHPADWRVQTTFWPELQDAAERAVAVGLRRLKRPGLQASLVALDPQNGDILAMVGGADYLHSTYNRATRTKRQPGSAFKPFVYATALEHGYTPVSLLSNLTRVAAPGDPEWIPRNAQGEQVDVLTLRAALMESNNAAAAELQQKVGSRAILGLASNAGLNDLPDVPSLALGVGVVSPLELTAAYTIFPGGGLVARPRGVINVVDGDGDETFSAPVARDRIMSETSAFQMVSMLRDVIDRGTGSAARALGVRGSVGGKTGTTDEYKDAWFVGFTNTMVVGVWVGFDQPTRIGPEAYGARIALPIWADFMKTAAAARPSGDFAVPDGLQAVELCDISYMRPVADCHTYTEYFKPEDPQPTQLCSIHRGDFHQRAAKAVGGFLRSLGKKIGSIFN